LVLSAYASTNDVAANHNPYASIPSHNVFSLSPPPPASTTNDPTKPPPKITLNGIMSIFGEFQALFKVNAALHPGQPAKDNAYILAENESQDGIEVVHIDAITGTVTFDNHGVVQKISLPVASGTAALNFAKGDPVTGTAYVVPKSYPPEFIRARIPDYLGGGPNADTNGPAVPNATLEQRILMIEAQRAYLKSYNDPAADSLPPTAMTPSEEPAPKNTDTQNPPEP